MSTIGILGSGRVGTGLAAGFGAAGHDVVVGTRSGRRPEGWAGPDLAFADHETTARRAEIVVNATPGDGAVQRLAPLRAALDGKLLIDVSNATRRGADGLPGGLADPDAGVAERLQEALPGTKVVKTLNTMLHSVMTAPRSLSTPPTAFLSGDDPEAKTTAGALLGDLGWPPEWIVDLGGIDTARSTEALVLLVPHVIRSRGMAPFAIGLAA